MLSLASMKLGICSQNIARIIFINDFYSAPTSVKYSDMQEPQRTSYFIVTFMFVILVVLYIYFWCLSSVSWLFFIFFSVHSRDNQDTKVTIENVPCMTKVTQASKPVEVTCTNGKNLQLKEVPAAASHSNVKSVSQKTVGVTENNACAKNESQKQNDRWATLLF